jgi:hypothetical protein
MEISYNYLIINNMTKIEELIKKSLKELSDVFGGTTKAGLIFPKYWNGTMKGKMRISEQEARFLFVQNLEKQQDLYYSVEVPTKKMYNFTDTPKIVLEDGKSAMFDVCIYDRNRKMECLLEFKSKQSTEKSIKKDFLKLLCDEDNLQNYFVHVVENCDAKTIPEIEKKYRAACSFVKNPISSLKIFLYILGNNKSGVDGNLIIYEVPEFNENNRKIINL